MSGLRISVKARADLDTIWEYTAKQWSLAQAEEYLRALGETMKLIAVSPYLGRSIDDIRPGYFKFPTASHVIFYRRPGGIVESSAYSTRAWTRNGTCEFPAGRTEGEPPLLNAIAIDGASSWRGMTRRGGGRRLKRSVVEE